MVHRRIAYLWALLRVATSSGGGGVDADGGVDDACCLAVRVQFVVIACTVFAFRSRIMSVVLWLLGTLHQAGVLITVSFHELTGKHI